MARTPLSGFIPARLLFLARWLGVSFGLSLVLAPVASSQPALKYYALNPCRVVDTRDPNGPTAGQPLAAGSTQDFLIVGVCGVPSSAAALSANVTAVSPASAGDFRIFAAGQSLPTSSVLSFRPGRTRANNAVIALNLQGRITVKANFPSGTSHFLLDISGFFYSGFAAPPASCTPAAFPYQFAPAGNPLGYGPSQKFKGGFATNFGLYSQSGTQRLILRENFGYTTYSLANPNVPLKLNEHDIEAVYPKGGDGYSTVVAVTATPDGTRALVNYNQSPHGNLLLKPFGNIFDFAGEFPPTSASGGIETDQYPTVSPFRYLGYALKPPPSFPAMTVSDISTFVQGANANLANSIPGEPVANTPPGFNLIRAGHFLIYATGGAVVVVDARSVGPKGALSASFRATSFGPSAFGLPSLDRLYNVTAAIHPVDGQLYILAETTLADASSSGFGLARTSDGTSLSIVGSKFLPPPQWAGGTSTNGATMIASASDILIFAWTKIPYPSGASDNKLFTWLASGWGTDLTPNYVVPANPTFPSVIFMRGLFLGGGQFATYVATQQGAFAIPVSCTLP